MAMRLLDLFSGIGGFSYAAETLIGGYETVAFCEMDEFCQKVLKKHWPQVPIFDDVRTLDASRLGRIDICTFGFPCQPVSQAGLQKAESDDRWLWDEIIRILQASKPKWIIAENVVGLITIENGLLIENCVSSLEAEGYEVQSVVIPACAKNAPHRRSRIWLIGQLTTNTNDTGNRTSRSNIDQEQQTIEQGWEKQSFFEFSRHDEAMANTENDRWEQTEWQGGEGVRGRSNDFSRSETEGQETVRTNVANTTSKGKWEITRGLGESQKEMGEKRSEFTTRADTSSTETGTNVANSKIKQFNESTNDTRFSEKKQGEFRRSGCKENVTNTDNERLQGHREHRQLEREQREKQFAKNSLQNEHRTNRKFEQRVGDMADGLSRGLLRHFDREPEHIPRVTTGEKDRAKKLKALGNSIVPQVAAEILLAIRISEESD